MLNSEPTLTWLRFCASLGMLSVTWFPLGPWKVTVRALRSSLTTLTTASVWPTTIGALSCAVALEASAETDRAAAATRMFFMFPPCESCAQRAPRTPERQLDFGPTRQIGKLGRESRIRRKGTHGQDRARAVVGFGIALRLLRGQDPDLPGLRRRRVRPRRLPRGRTARKALRAARTDGRRQGAAVPARGRSGDRCAGGGAGAAAGRAGATRRPAPGQAQSRARRRRGAARPGACSRGPGSPAAEARRSPVRGRRHPARAARGLARQPRDQGGAGARARRPDAGIPASRASGPDPGAERPGRRGASRDRSDGLEARP